MTADPCSGAASAATIARAVRERRVTARAVLEAALTRIDTIDARINAFTARCTTRARERADRIDAIVAAGGEAGPLAGVPFAVKAQIAIAGLTTTAGSTLHAGDPPAMRNAVATACLERAGAICVGATNMDELGMGGTTENRNFGPTRNPHDLSRVPGGSSGGSAAVVAAGIVPMALGSDGLGSVRLPAALCGVYGLRPTRGAVSADGLLPPPGTLATIGPIARNVGDLAACFAAISARAVVASPRADAGITRVGVARGYFARNLDESAAAAIEIATRALNATPVDYPEAERARAAAILVNAAESATPQLDRLRQRPDDYDPLTRDRFLAHALMPAAWYLRAQAFRRWHKQEVLRLLDEFPVLLFPAAPCVALAIGTRTLTIDGQQTPTGPALGLFAQPLAALDCPVLAVPIAHGGPLPAGVQLLAAPGEESTLFAVAATLERLGKVRTAPADIPA
jgi:AtzE family amidohydrolase